MSRLVLTVLLACYALSLVSICKAYTWLWIVVEVVVTLFMCDWLAKWYNFSRVTRFLLLCENIFRKQR